MILLKGNFKKTMMKIGRMRDKNLFNWRAGYRGKLLLKKRQLEIKTETRIL